MLESDDRIQGLGLTSCDTETGHEIVCYSPDGSLQVERSPVCCDETIDRNSHDQGDVQPVDVLVPVRLGNWLLGDVRFLGVVSLVTVRL